MKLKFIKIDKTLVGNTFYLYLLTFSTHLLSLATVPYLTRILGPTTYGKVGVALAYMSYVAIIMDLGFVLSATQKVVDHKNNREYIGKLLFSVITAKLVLGTVVSCIFLLYVFYVPNMRKDMMFYVLYLFSYIINAFLPDFYYRGIEKMRSITYRAVLVKTYFMLMIFVFIKSETDYYKIPLINLIGNAVAVLIMYVDMWKKYHVRIFIPSFRELSLHIKETLPFFISRIASTVYQALNTIVLSFIYGASPIIGYYTSADKIVSLSKTASSPIADSLYPYMLREKNYHMIKKMLFIVMPVILVGACILFVFAEPVCVFLFGAAYADAGNVLRCLLPIMVVIFPTYVLCFPVMVPMGLSKYANASNIVGMVIQIVGLVFLVIIDRFNIYGICILSSFSEVSVFLFRLTVILHHSTRNSPER